MRPLTSLHFTPLALSMLAFSCVPDGRRSGSLPDLLSDTSSDSGEERTGTSDAGWGGMGGEPTSMTDEGDSAGVCSGIVCGKNATCAEDNGRALCQCLAGYSGPDCADINECTVPDRCGPYGTCVNLPGDYLCECPAGMRNGKNGCEDIDECAEGTDSCAEAAECKNAMGTHFCTCAPGTFGDGTFCKQVNHCTGDPCGPGQCHNTKSGYACECPLGTTGASCEGTCEGPIVFEDGKLESAVRTSAGITDEEVALNVSDLEGVTSLFVPPPDPSANTDDEIESLAGLECWPTLKVLDLKGHPTTDLAALSSLGSLETLDLQCTQSVDLSPLAGLSQLRNLNLSKSSLCGTTQRQPGDLSFAQDLTQLRVLEAGAWAYVANLAPLSSLARLHTLGLRAIGLEDLSALSSLPRLHTLSVSDNSLSNLEALQSLNELTVLRAASSHLSSIDALSTLSRLREVDLGYNSLTSLGALASLESLNIAYLDGNKIADVSPLAQLTELVVLDLSNNQIKNLTPLSATNEFQGAQLWITDNPFECGDMQNELFTLLSRGVNVVSDCAL